RGVAVDFGAQSKVQSPKPVVVCRGVLRFGFEADGEESAGYFLAVHAYRRFSQVAAAWGLECLAALAGEAEADRGVSQRVLLHQPRDVGRLRRGALQELQAGGKVEEQ